MVDLIETWTHPSIFNAGFRIRELDFLKTYLGAVLSGSVHKTSSKMKAPRLTDKILNQVPDWVSPCGRDLREPSISDTTNVKKLTALEKTDRLTRQLIIIMVGFTLPNSCLHRLQDQDPPRGNSLMRSLHQFGMCM